MNEQSKQTTNIVKRHLNAFAVDLGIEAMIADYHDDAILISRSCVYSGKHEIRQFFENFIDHLPDNAREDFRLQSYQVCNEMAYITWTVADRIPLGTDTFVVRNGKIIQQTFAMYSN